MIAAKGSGVVAVERHDLVVERDTLCETAH